jgi:transcriptional regulator with XRE-family HTH domain
MMEFSVAKGFSQRLKETREARSMSASDLARLVDVSPTAVWNWEKNDVTPRRDTLAQIAQVLGVSRDFLRTGAKDTGADWDSEKPGLKKLNDVPLEELMRAIEAKGFSVSVTPKAS